MRLGADAVGRLYMKIETRTFLLQWKQKDKPVIKSVNIKV